jgi:hypothetical protein
MGISVRRQILVFRCLKGQSGTSMVSVMAAFVILMLGILMTTVAIHTAARVSGGASRLQRDVDRAVADYYLETEDYTSDKVTIIIQQKGNPAAGIAKFEGVKETYVYPLSTGKHFSLYSFRSVKDVEETEE